MSGPPVAVPLGPATTRHLTALATGAPLVQMLLDAYLEGAGRDPAARYRLVLHGVSLEPEPQPPDQGQDGSGTVEGAVQPPEAVQGAEGEEG